MVHLIESKERQTSLIAKNPGVPFPWRAPFSGRRAHRILALHGPARWDINARRLVAKLHRKQKGNANYFERVTIGQKSLAPIRRGKIGMNRSCCLFVALLLALAVAPATLAQDEAPPPAQAPAGAAPPAGQAGAPARPPQQRPPGMFMAGPPPHGTVENYKPVTNRTS